MIGFVSGHQSGFLFTRVMNDSVSKREDSYVNELAPIKYVSRRPFSLQTSAKDIGQRGIDISVRRSRAILRRHAHANEHLLGSLLAVAPPSLHSH